MSSQTVLALVAVALAAAVVLATYILAELRAGEENSRPAGEESARP